MALSIEVKHTPSVCQILAVGRIDGMSSLDIEQTFNSLTSAGERQILVDFTEVKYISSAGLRVFLAAQKKLMAVGGQILLYNPAPSVLEVFRVSGFYSIFKFFSRPEEVAALLNGNAHAPGCNEKNVNGIDLIIKTGHDDLYPLTVVGDPEKVMTAGYTPDDLVSVNPGDIRFGTGLAAVGENTEDVCQHLGETVLLNHNIYFYPAAKRSMPDFVDYSPDSVHVDYQFLHGFGYSGDYSRVIAFSHKDALIDLNELIRVIQGEVDSNLFGIVMIAESKGHKGMNLKKIPLAENRNTGDTNIFSRENLPDWMNFSVDPEYIDHIVVMTGLVCRDKSKLDPKIQAHFPGENPYHLHSAIFSTGIINTSVESLDSELTRILREQTLLKIQHTQGSSKLGVGIVGITSLKE